ncbi:MAG: glycerol-3-phosphate dehydrogenase/oxidase [Rhodospirillales bacterium]
MTDDARERQIERLRRERLDVLILGGGINGAGVARDLALRARETGTPLSIGLVEQAHFACGASSRNSQLIHGGLRYLKNLEFRLVREALRERALLLRLAPDYVRPLRFFMPVYGWLERNYYNAGLALYDLLAGKARIERHRMLSRDEAVRLEPELSVGLRGAALFYDARLNSAQFTLANICDAIDNDAAAVNYVRAEAWEREAEGWRVHLRDTLSGEVFETRARKLVDTTGPWSHAGGLRLVRGSHLVFPRLNRSDNAIAWFEESGRIIFIIPWGEDNQLSLVGTTDVDHEQSPDDVHISSEETAYLLRIVKELFPRVNARPLAAFSALRPLLRDEAASPTHTSREHRIWNDPAGVLHVSGGKYTTYRLMSEEAADLAAREIAPPLAGVHPTSRTPFRAACLPDSRSERIAFAVRHEMARRLSDLMFISTYWGYEQPWDRERLEPYAREMGAILGWDRERMEQDIEAVLSLRAVPDLTPPSL